MNRAGREPAEDLKRRFAAACQEVELTAANVSMHLINAVQCRTVLAEASLPDWPHESSMRTIMANVPLTGAWPETVDIRCSGSDDRSLRMNGPWMCGRSNVPIEQLIDHPCETLDEREQVIAAAKLGIPGPYEFKTSVWKRANLTGSGE